MGQPPAPATMPPIQLGGLPGLPPLVPPPAGAMPKSTPPTMPLGGPAGSLPAGVPSGKGDAAPAGDGIVGKGETNGKGTMLGKIGKGGWTLPTSDSWAPDGMNGGPPRPAWTCKILLHADSLHPEFPVLSKVVGQGGQNVEHIRSQTSCVVQLRGKGSGFLEPETGQELPEPLFVWLANDNATSGKSAVELFQDLLKHVYEEHQAFVQQRGAAPPPALEPSVLEGADPPRAVPPGPCLAPPGLAPGLGAPGVPPFTAPGAGGPGFTAPAGPLMGTPGSGTAPGLPPLATAPGAGGPGDFYRPQRDPGGWGQAPLHGQGPY